MKNFKKLIAAATIVGMLGVVGVAVATGATSATTPAGILAELTGKSVETVTAERVAGTTFGTMAKDAGVLDQFKTDNLAQKKAMLEQRVTDGNLTQAQADQFIKSIEDNQTTCDGTGSAGMGQKSGMGFGQGTGRGAGAGAGQRSGGGFGGGMGIGCALNTN